MAENHGLGLRSSSMGHRDRLNPSETPPPPVLSNASTQVRTCKNDHQETSWRKRAGRATVKVDVCRRRWEDGIQAAQRRGGERGIFAHRL